MSLLLREKLTGRPAPAEAGQVLELWRDWIEQKASADIARLGENLEDQQAFARTVRDILASMDMAEELSQEEPSDDEEQNDERTPSSDENEGRRRRKSGRFRFGWKAKSRTVPAMKANRARWTRRMLPPTKWTTARISMRKHRAIRAVRTSLSPILPSMSIIKVFTREFDEEVEATDLCDEAELDRLRGFRRSSLPICRAW
ncbi:hypothetical protein VXQ18_02370 [Brucella abortus]|nr:hypothetical protein [Brucella abortus]